MTCVPPKEKPNQSPNDLFCRPTYPNSLKIEIHIGFKSYYYKCLDYYFLNLELIVGLTVGLGILALIAICVALFFCIRKLRSRKKPPPSGGPLQRLQEVDHRDSPFIRPSSPQSNLTTSPQNTKRNNFENLRMNILRNYNANGYSTEIRNENYLQSQDDGEPQTDDVERQTDDVAAFPQNYYRRTIYPPDYIQRRDNEYTSTINNDSAECGAYDNHSGPGDGIGGLQSPPRQSYIPPSFGNSWENYDYNLSENGDESEDKDTYANFGEIGCN